MRNKLRKLFHLVALSCIDLLCDRHEYYGNVKIYYMQIRCAEVDWAGQPGHFTEHWQTRIDDDDYLESGLPGKLGVMTNRKIYVVR